MLKVDNLKVCYGYNDAVRGVTFEVNQGEIVTIIGSNGAGKSSILRSISNITMKKEGRVLFQGKDVTNLMPHEIVEMGICHVPEGRRIFGNLSVEENLFMGAYTKKNQSKDEYNKNIQRVFDLFPRLKERRNQDGSTLSGGEQQMLAIGRGLMLEPKILMLDEPSLGLAPILVENIFNLIVEIKEKTNTAVLLVEQNAKKALQIATRGYVLELGKIIQEGKSKDLLNDAKLVEAYLGI